MIMWPDNDCVSFGGWCQTPPIPTVEPVIIVVGIKKEEEKNSQKGKKKREKKGFP